MSLLTLDQTTLFYWNLSNEYLKPKFTGTNDVAQWSASIPKGIKPSGKRTASTPSLITSRSNASQTTSATRPPPSVVSQASALSNGIKVSGTDDNDLMEKGAISDRDETRGEEYEAKMMSPLKSGKRLTSAVSTISTFRRVRTLTSIQHKVKVELGTAPIPAASKGSRRSNMTLPERFQEGAIWGASVIPTMIKWAGTQSRIFKIPRNKIASMLEIVCRFYYDDDSISFASGDAVVTTVCIILFYVPFLI